MKKTSVLITTYHENRQKDIPSVIHAWLGQPIHELWLIDQSKDQKNLKIKDERFTHWKMPIDCKTRSDYGLAHLTTGDYVCFADDDIYPRLTFASEMISWMEELSADFVGVIGRQFEKQNYNSGSHFFASSKITEPVRVDFCGVLYFVKRKFINFDPIGIVSPNIDDLYHAYQFPQAKKYVVPMKHYVNLPECNKNSAMCKNKKLMTERNKFYNKIYQELKKERLK